uniref:Intracellular protein transport protein USO1-like n=1 Tax=Nicotiana tabacum TaxID=4097 RepID=A0A1S3XJR6_TOBAC|nr:PREDICTED: intracellular protein transport protein USO1-like [Nicotiana tabacum]
MSFFMRPNSSIAGIGEFFEMMSSSEEEVGSSAPKPKKDNKRKGSSKIEDTQIQAKTARSRKKSAIINVDIDSVHHFMDDDGDEMEGSTLVTRTRKSPWAIKPSEIGALSLEEGTLKEKRDEGPASLDVDAVRDAQNLKTSKLGGVPSENNLCQSCFAGVDEANPADVFDKIKTELHHCEAELRRASNEEKTLRLLLDKKEEELKHLRPELTKAREYENELEKQVTFVLKKYGLPLPSLEAHTSISQLQQKLDMTGQLRGEVDQVRAECNNWKAKMDTLVVDKNDALSKVSSLEVQLRNAQGSNLVQAGRIAELEDGVANAKAEVVEARAEAREIQTKDDRMIEHAKVDEADAKFVLSSDDDDHVEDDEEEGVSKEATPRKEAGPKGVTERKGVSLIVCLQFFFDVFLIFDAIISER